MLVFCCFIFQAPSQHCVKHMDFTYCHFFSSSKTINYSIPLHLSHLHKISFPLLHCSRVVHSCIFSLFSMIYFLFISITCISLLHCWFYLLKLAFSIVFSSTFHKLHASSLDITISSSWLGTLQSLCISSFQLLARCELCSTFLHYDFLELLPSLSFWQPLFLIVASWKFVKSST